MAVGGILAGTISLMAPVLLKRIVSVSSEVRCMAVEVDPIYSIYFY